MQHSYQLTSHPSGSKREFWTLTWPLMIGLLSSTVMFFVDRLFLARWNPLALNAAVSGGVAYYMFLVIPLGVVEITEVLVGRLHGEERHKEIGSAAWQMVLITLILIPLSLIVAYWGPSILFNGSSNIAFETEYFSTLMVCAPLQCAALSLSGFFIGLGNVKIVTFSAIVGNIVNIALDYWFIYGGGPIPSLGVIGAALATGISELVQMAFLLVIYWNKSNKEQYGTASIGLNKPFMFEGLRLGLPSGIGRSMEIVAHFLFFRIVMSVGPDQMALVAIVQSIYILSSFVIDAQSKGASAIVSNLLGADQKEPIANVLRSGFKLHTFYFLAFFFVALYLPEEIYTLFSSEEGVALQMDPMLMQTFKRALLLGSLFFLIDGFVWILIGFLTAAKDTRFIFWVSLLINWIAYIPPTYFFIGVNKGGADVAWLVVVTVTFLTLIAYLWRFYSGRWLKYNDRQRVL